MEKNRKFYLKLFLSTFYLSAFTFGGGYVIVPLMRKKFVNEYGWIDENEMIDLIAIAQSAPGVIAINASLIIGYKLAGILNNPILKKLQYNCNNTISTSLSFLYIYCI